MINTITYTSNQIELQILVRNMQDLAAKLTDEHWQYEQFSQIEKLRSYIDSQPLVDMSCFDVTRPGDFDTLQDFRRVYREMMLLLIADNTVPMTKYLRPGIRPDSLLLSPFRPEDIRQTFSDLINTYICEVASEDPNQQFRFDDEYGKTSIPYSSIYYFEAKAKKVYVRTKNEEYGFYGTLDQLEEELPEQFQRCHRGFIVNTDHLETVKLSQNLIELDDGLDVPLSRSYKPLFKEYR